jgi:hypothetical protein
MALKSLLTSRRFWLAVFGIVQTIVFVYIPTFPREVWIAIDSLVGVLIVALTIDDAAATAAGVHYLTGEKLK